MRFDMNCPAFFVAMFSICLLAAHLVMPSPVLSLSIFLFLPLAIAVVGLTILEYHQSHNGKHSSQECHNTR